MIVKTFSLECVLDKCQVFFLLLIFLSHFSKLIIKRVIFKVYSLGMLITQKDEIFSHYLRGDFSVDVLVVSPFILE